ncbi:MAG TPA: phosphoribosyltransferase family protein [Thermoanaerobaculia bacterium]
MNVANWLTTIGRESARIVLHSRCIVCEAELPWRDRAGSCCGRCWHALPKITRPKCRRCAVVWETDQEVERYLCIPCRDRETSLDWIDAWGDYSGGLERVIHAFKFERHDFLSGPLAGLLFETWSSRADAEFDAVVPVPMHRKKLRRRGYNQAELLARGLARRTGIRLERRMLESTGLRETQSTLARDERAANVRGAFVAASAANARSILVVDDICTTGETLRACADALHAAGAARVSALAVARA